MRSAGQLSNQTAMCKGFQSVLCELGCAFGPAGFVNEDGSQKYKDYADYITNHIRRPGVGPLAGWRMGEDGCKTGAATRTKASSMPISRTAASGVDMCQSEAQYLQTVQHGLSGLGRGQWASSTRAALHLSALRRADAQIPAGRRRSWRPSAARVICANGSKRRWTRCRSGMRPRMKTTAEEYPVTL